MQDRASADDVIVRAYVDEHYVGLADGGYGPTLIVETRAAPEPLPPSDYPQVRHSRPVEAVEETTLYRLYGADEILLYIGISDDWVKRISAHARSQGWWDEVEAIRCERFESRSAALQAEAQAIKQEHPRYNVRAG